MTIFFSVMLLMIAVIGANIISTFFPAIPIAIYQILAGLLLSFVPLYHHFTLEPELFMLVIIAPIMFNDGQNTNLRKLRKSVSTILSMAVFLAFATVVVIGYLYHFIDASIPLALCFAFAAIVTPTDAVAVSSITSNLAVPEKVMGNLKNESLFNDASGLVAFGIALTAYETGQFSFGHSVTNFLYVFIGGLLFGMIMGVLILQMRRVLLLKAVDVSAIILPINFITPFVVYLFAEALGFSGILAVVATGMMHGLSKDRMQLSSTRLQIVSTTTWSLISALLNGFVFVLLGVSLPTVFTDVLEDGSLLPRLTLMAVLAYLVMTLIRFLWTYYGQARHHRNDHSTLVSDALTTALAGVHGTITLAMAFSLPVMANGAPFPYRTATIYVATIVILLSLAVPTIALPFLLEKKAASISANDLAEIRNNMVAYAVRQLMDNHQDQQVNLENVVETLNSQRGYSQPDRALISQLNKRAADTEIDAVNDAINTGKVDSRVGRGYLRGLVLQSQSANLNSWQRLLFFFRAVRTRFGGKRLHLQDRNGRNLPQQSRQSQHAELEQRKAQYQEMAKSETGRQKLNEQRQQFFQMETMGFDAVMTFLNQEMTTDNATEIGMVRRYYTVRHTRFNESETAVDEQNALFIEAFQSEHNFISDQLNQQKIPRDVAKQLNEQITTDELVYMQSVDE